MLSRDPRPFAASFLLLTIFALAPSAAASPQAAASARSGATAITAADYARAEKFLAAGVNPLVIGGTLSATWLADDRFAYRNTTAAGGTYDLSPVGAGRPTISKSVPAPGPENGAKTLPVTATRRGAS